jgi:putative oxidoreductase
LGRQAWANPECAQRLDDARGAIALIFVLAGAEKFGPGWVGLFQQVGVGQWFRFFTGGIEILSGVPARVPRTVGPG